MELTNSSRIFLLIIAFVLAIIGFMVKLPSVFYHTDKLLHTSFYFSAAAFIHVLFNIKKLWIHVLVFVVLYFLGISIEYAQEYSNTLFHKRIHGRYDPEDVKANVKGIVAFSYVWVVLMLMKMGYNRIKMKNA